MANLSTRQIKSRTRASNRRQRLTDRMQDLDGLRCDLFKLEASLPLARKRLRHLLWLKRNLQTAIHLAEAAVAVQPKEAVDA